MVSPSTSLPLRNKKFLRYWLSRFASVAGSALSRFVLPLEVLDRTGSETLAAAVTTVSLAPILLVGLPAGVFADRHSRVRIMRTCEIISATTMVLLGLALALDSALSWPVYLGVALVSACAVLFDAGSFGLLPTLVDRNEIAEANSLLYGSNTVVSLIAPAVGGFIFVSTDITTIVSINAATFAISVALLLTMPTDEPQVHSRESSSFRGDLLIGLRVIALDPLLRFLVGAGAASGIAGGAFTAGLVVIVTQRLDADAETLGVVISIMGAGAVCGSLFLSVVSSRVAATHVALVGFPLAVCVFVWISLDENIVTFLAGCFAWGVVYTALIINNVTLRQTVLPNSLQARVNTTARTIAWGGEPVGAALLAGLLAIFPLRESLLVSVVPFACLSLLIWFTPLRKGDLESLIIPEPADGAKGRR